MSEAHRPTDGPRFFGRRKGKALKRSAALRVETLLPALTIATPAVGTRLDPRTLFPERVTDIWLEVGFGGGEHVAAQARRYPDVGIVAGEVFINGIAGLLAHLEGSGIDTVRIFPEDIRRLLPSLPDGCLGRVFVLFPDPWPKARHAGRRFIGPENLDELARLMAPGAELRVASDDPVYQDWAQHHLRAHPAFAEIQVTTDRPALPDDWPQTRYEKKCITGRAPVFLRFQRREPVSLASNAQLG